MYLNFSDSNLQVTSISFNNIIKSGFRISWSMAQSHLQDVSRYLVSWTPDVGSEERPSNAVTKTLSGLSTPGQKYTITITTYNDVTQVNSPRSVTVSKEQATSKFVVKDNIQ